MVLQIGIHVSLTSLCRKDRKGIPLSLKIISEVESMKQLYVGIDTSKDKHDVCVKDETGKVLLGHLRIQNTQTDLKRLYERLDKLKKSSNGCMIIFGMEATGIYYLPLYYALVNDGYAVKLYNPIQSHGYRKLEIRKTKTDKIDAAIITDMLRYSETPMLEDINPDLYALRELCRTRHRIIRKIADCKRQLTRNIDMLWPGYEKFFSDIFGKTSCAVLKRYSVPAKLIEKPFEDFYDFLTRTSRTQFKRDKAENIYEVAKNTLSIPPLEPIGRIEIRMLLTQLNLLDKQKERLEKHIQRIMQRRNCKITSIPGIGNVLGAIILGEIGDIKRFSNARKLIAYAGLDPSVSQSGRVEGNGGKISKRGSPLLRHALFLAANNARQCDKVFKEYYEKKMAKGKHFKVAVTATAGKMLRVVYYVLKEDKEYRIVSN